MNKKAYLIVAALSLIAPNAFAGSDGVIMGRIQEGISKIKVQDDSVATAQARFRFAMREYASEGRLKSASYSPNEHESYTYTKLVDKNPHAEDRSVAKACSVSIYSLTADVVQFQPNCQQ